VLQCVAVCCSLLQCIYIYANVYVTLTPLIPDGGPSAKEGLPTLGGLGSGRVCVAVCCSVGALPCVRSCRVICVYVCTQIYAERPMHIKNIPKFTTYSLILPLPCVMSCRVIGVYVYTHICMQRDPYIWKSSKKLRCITWSFLAVCYVLACHLCVCIYTYIYTETHTYEKYTQIYDVQHKAFCMLGSLYGSLCVGIYMSCVNILEACMNIFEACKNIWVACACLVWIIEYVRHCVYVWVSVWASLRRNMYVSCEYIRSIQRPIIHTFPQKSPTFSQKSPTFSSVRNETRMVCRTSKDNCAYGKRPIIHTFPRKSPTFSHKSPTFSD